MTTDWLVSGLPSKGRHVLSPTEVPTIRHEPPPIRKQPLQPGHWEEAVVNPHEPGAPGIRPRREREPVVPEGNRPPFDLSNAYVEVLPLGALEAVGPEPGPPTRNVPNGLVAAAAVVGLLAGMVYAMAERGLIDGLGVAASDPPRVERALRLHRP